VINGPGLFDCPDELPPEVDPGIEFENAGVSHLPPNVKSPRQLTRTIKLPDIIIAHTASVYGKVIVHEPTVL
jgi:hypothetical protein